jgi:N-acetylmuramate 1-kinase
MMSWSMTLTEEAMTRLARNLSLWLKPGDLVMLQGDLGTGKSSFARAMIRELAGNEQLDVPSPTFSLLQHYNETRIPLVHADLYRLKGMTEVAELGLGELLSTHAVLVEWPDRDPSLAVHPDRLDVILSGSGSGRTIRLVPHGRWENSLRREQSLEDFLQTARRGSSLRSFFQGDASTRRYELIKTQEKIEVLMDMPTRSDHAVVKDGKSYSTIVHLADDISAVLAVNHQLASLGYAAPEVFAADAVNGFALIEYLDGELHGDMMRRGADMRAPFQSAVEVLVDMTTKDWPSELTTPSGVNHKLHQYDVAAQLFETSLLPSWFWPHLFNSAAPGDATAAFEDIWNELLHSVPMDHIVWVLRDYHSPNLIWMPHRMGLQRTGIIDSQDATIGHPAYDLVSLLQDARVDVAPAVQDHFLDTYLSLRKALGNVEETAFRTAYAIHGAQRATRLLGTFTRLSKRDGKHQYLQHRPRVARYLRRNLDHPALAPLKAWYEKHLPQALALADS